jgi:CRP-like cAMP-binding protein
MMRGRILLTVVNPHGKEAVVGVVGPGEFFGEECIREAETRGSSAVTLERSTLVRIEKQDLRHTLRNSAEFCENFLHHLVYRKNLAEEALADQLFNSSERRLARVLMVLARNPNLAPAGTVPRMSQTILAAMVGTTRPRISYFLGKFRRMGLIEGRSTLRVHVSRIENMLAE